MPPLPTNVPCLSRTEGFLPNPNCAAGLLRPGFAQQQSAGESPPTSRPQRSSWDLPPTSGSKQTGPWDLPPSSRAPAAWDPWGNRFTEHQIHSRHSSWDLPPTSRGQHSSWDRPAASHSHHAQAPPWGFPPSSLTTADWDPWGIRFPDHQIQNGHTSWEPQEQRQPASLPITDKSYGLTTSVTSKSVVPVPAAVPEQTISQPVTSNAGPSGFGRIETPPPSLITPGHLLQSGLSTAFAPQSIQTTHKDVEVVHVSSKPVADSLAPGAAESQPPILPLPPNRAWRKRLWEPAAGYEIFSEDFDFLAYEDEDDVELPNVEVKPIYNKDDFFESLSSNALNNDPNHGRTRYSEQIKLDTETCGVYSRYRVGVGRTNTMCSLPSIAELPAVTDPVLSPAVESPSIAPRTDPIRVLFEQMMAGLARVETRMDDYVRRPS
ncbi:uncharacterized protein LOC121745867 [Salvia splendens]|uniref:uncharacterized protein LOC121745867 n=1 Tax=Salvia splendens TaxID=180675 RepID=UPI001C25516E|nr:uncharacterized protein LOC121745867 [Salvia splendens]